jgi:hypothetical protein
VAIPASQVAALCEGDGCQAARKIHERTRVYCGDHISLPSNSARWEKSSSLCSGDAWEVGVKVKQGSLYKCEGIGHAVHTRMRRVGIGVGRPGVAEAFVIEQR